MANSLEKVCGTMSCSRFSSLQKCEFQFYMSYVEGIKVPPTAALAFGRADDETKNTVYDHKIATQDRIEGGETMEASDSQELFATAFEKAADDIEDWGKEEKGSLLDIGVRAIWGWREEVAVNTVPVATQHEFHVPIEYVDNDVPQKFDFMGYIDLVEEVPNAPRQLEHHTELVDNKTAGRKWGASKVASEIQPVGYGIAAKEDPALIEMGVSPYKMSYHIAVKKKTPEIQHPGSDPAMRRHMDDSELQGFKRMLAAANSKMRSLYESGNWLPNRSHNMCSKRWCGYWRECQATWGGTVKD